MPYRQVIEMRSLYQQKIKIMLLNSLTLKITFQKHQSALQIGKILYYLL